MAVGEDTAEVFSLFLRTGEVTRLLAEDMTLTAASSSSSLDMWLMCRGTLTLAACSHSCYYYALN